FKPFSERIANIDIDVFHRIGHKNEIDEGSGTYFHKALWKWSDLNLTESFDTFKKELPATHTLPQLLQKKDEVVAVLIKYIKLQNPLSLQPILELVVALAQDLRQEFYSYYSEFVQHLIALLNSKDSEQLEWTFTCLAYIFKFLWRYLVKDVEIVFTGLLPLLDDSKPEYINNFAAESFAFVARKVKDKKAFLSLVLKTLKKHPEGVGGCGRLLFAVMNGVSGQFHSCADSMLPLVIDLLADKSVSQKLLTEVLTHMKTDSSDDMPIHQMLNLVLQAIVYKNGAFASDPVIIAQPVIELLKNDELHEDSLLVLSEIGSVLLMSPIIRLPQEYSIQIIMKVLALTHTKILVAFVERILRYPAFEALVLPQIIKHCQNLIKSDASDKVVGIGRDFLHLLTVMVLNKAPVCKSGMDLQQWSQYPIRFRQSQKEVEDNPNQSIPSRFLNELCVTSTDEILKKLEDFICTVVCIPHIKPLDQNEAINNLKNVVTVLCASLTETSGGEIKTTTLSEKNEIVTNGDMEVEDEGQIDKIIKIEAIEFVEDSQSKDDIQGGSKENDQLKKVELVEGSRSKEVQGGNAESNELGKIALPNTDVGTEEENQGRNEDGGIEDGDEGKNEENNSENIEQFTDSDSKELVQGGSAENSLSENIDILTNSSDTIELLTDSETKVEDQEKNEVNESEKIEDSTDSDAKVDDQGESKESNQSEVTELTNTETKIDDEGETEHTMQAETKELVSNGDMEVEESERIEESNKSESIVVLPDSDTNEIEQGRTDETNYSQSTESPTKNVTEMENQRKTEEPNLSESIESPPNDTNVEAQTRSEESNQSETVEIITKSDMKVEDQEKTEVLLFVLKVVLESLVHLVDRGNLKSVCSLDTILNTVLPYASNPRFVNSLRILDLYLTAYRIDTEDEVRFLTAHILSLFELIESSESPVTDYSIFRTCLAAELIPPTVHEYRDKLKCLQSLEFTAIQSLLLKHPEFNKVPLHFLLGNLYINFQLLWEPTMKIISTHAHGLSLVEFWDVFKERLQLTVQQIKNTPDYSSEPSLLQCDFLKELFSALNNLDDKPDYVNYRLLLWKAMTGFLDVCESRNRDICPLFLSFLEEEYYNSSVEMAFSWNIKSRNIVIDEKHDDEPMGVDDADEEPSNEDREIEDIKNELLRPTKPSQPNAKVMLQTVLAHLGVFSKMRNPSSIHKEKELRKVYLNFLTHRNPEVQKTFKTELTEFRVDKESDIIQKEHRVDLIPIVMRSGPSGQVRRSLVLRFLAGCHESELLIFLEMAFRVYADLVQDDPKAMVDSIIDKLDLEHIVPPRRLQSSLNLLSIIMERFGRLMGEKMLSYVLRVLLCISSIVQGTLMQRDVLHPGYLPILLTLRNTCQEIAARFFEHMDTYPWSEVELDVVFRMLVWPWLDKLPVEGIHSPTSLLKLFLVWSRNARYFVLLGKHAEGNKDLTPLPYIMNLLNRTQTHPSVTTAIMELVERLLTFQDYDETGTDAAPKIPDGLTLPIDEDALKKLPACKNLNYGSYLLLPHIPAILERLERKLGSLKSRGLSQRDLMVLSRATELVWDATTSDTLLRLILPILGKKAGAGEETVSHLITTLDNLFRNVQEPEKHLRYLAPLFGTVSAIGPRKLLNELLATIAKCASKDQRTKLQSSAELICKLNAFDAKWVEQPDFSQRLDGFSQVQEILKQEQIYLELGAIILHNCYHFIRTEKDMSLKDSAGYCLHTLAPALCLQFRNSPSDLQYILSDTILNLIRAGIKDKQDVVKYESIKLLGVMARECGELHPVLQDLSKLANKVDMEVDFFENIVHLQSHRKSRALLKFCNVAKELTKAPNSKTLTHFILPLTSMFLCSDKHGHKHTLVDAAIEAIGVICRLLPWHQYEAILRFYLAKLQHEMDYQKQLVRIVVAILDSFHFDLSRAEISIGKGNENKTTESQDDSVKEKPEIEPEKSEAMDVEGSSVDTKEADENNDVENEEDKPKAGEEPVSEELLEERLEQMIDVESEDTKQDEEKNSEVVNGAVATPVRAIEKHAVLTRSVANYAVQTITSGLLPHIHRVMAQLTQSELSHKFSKKQTAAEKEDESILRVPIALAAVKLLQRLPSYMLDQNLRGILIKLCTFLKSRLDSIRRVTRETLQKIMLTLGPKYLELLIDEMTVMLTRGYQVHVLIYTIHAVLVTLKDKFQAGDIDLCKKDLFGAVAEEKEVNQITGKLFEAKAMKSYDTFHILAQFITENCFVDLLLPIKECTECLRQINAGLLDNTFVPIESVLIFMYGVASESIPDLVTSMKKEEITPAQKELLARERPDTFIIPAAPRNRFGANVTAKTSSKTNAHILVEFGLQLFHSLLKRESVQKPDFRTYLDPMVPILCECLTAQHVKLTTKGLKCLSWILKLDLPSLKANMNSISVAVFKLLHKYAAAGLSKGDNFDLVVAVIVRDVKYYTITEDQLKALLLYAEQDMHDYNRQATAFILLKAVLSRKLVAPEMPAVMTKVANLSIVSEYPHVRLQARQVFHQFLMDYPLGKKLEKHIAFYRLLTEQSGMLYITLGARLVNDDSPDCRKMVEHRRLAAQLCGFFVTVEKSEFENRLATVFPLILKQFSAGPAEDRPGRFVRAPALENNSADVDKNEKVRDHLLFQVLQLMMKLSTSCPDVLGNEKWQEDMEIVTENCQVLLAHPHEWVRLASAQLLGHLFSSLDADKVAKAALSENHEFSRIECGYFYSDAKFKLKSLILDLCAQLQPCELSSDLIEQVVKNLVFLGRIMKRMSVTGQENDKEPDEESENNIKLSLLWMIRKMRKIRTAVFKWIGAMVVDLGREGLPPVAYQLLSPLARELNSNNESDSGKQLSQLARQVASLIKKKIGMETYTRHLSRLQTNLDNNVSVQYNFLFLFLHVGNKIYVHFFFQITVEYLLALVQISLNVLMSTTVLHCTFFYFYT
ncbi:hypothetical protein C0J52_11812, partial [Blattella germanica]